MMPRFHYTWFLFLLCCWSVLRAHGQVALQTHFRPQEKSFAPRIDIDRISDTEYTVLKHPHFPSYDVRIKKSRFCDGTVRTYTGYIDIEARHLFFYFFESRSDPENDDVIFWTSGGRRQSFVRVVHGSLMAIGPGGSSAVGLFTKLGPCRISGPDETTFHPESWNSNANIFFVDQPVGTGFSYADFGELVDTSAEAAKDIAAFVAIFFHYFTKFQGNAFHFAGESYAGREIPLFAAALYDQNTRLKEAGMVPVNLASIMLGNGITDIYTMVISFYDMTCTPATVPPILSIDTCVRMKQAIPRCQRWLKKSCIDTFDAINCKAARTFCLRELAEPYDSDGRNPYFIGGPYCEDDLCGSEAIKNMTIYLNLPEVRNTLGVDPAKGNFSAINYTIPNAFSVKMDDYEQTTLYVGALLERGIRVLIYVGNYDWICNWVGNERWTLNLEWTEQKEFVKQPLREWFVDGKVAGLTRSVGGFTFATIEGAGHMAPGDKPTEALALMQRWIARKGL